MGWQHIGNYLRVFFAVACLFVTSLAEASEYRGQVTFGGLPVPGATITATQGSKHIVTITDQQGQYSFADLADGTWTIEVAMTCFAMIKQDVMIPSNTPVARWELRLLPLDQIMAGIKPVVPAARRGSPQVKSERTT